jgi:glycosyltransferase involved in cell wall biosynthesis
MRISHVITRLIVGGAQENTIASVLGLARKPGFTVNLISGPSTGPEGSLESAFSGSPGTLTVVPELVRPVHPLKDWIALRRLTELFKKTRPHLVHTHSGKAGVLGRLAAARAKVPIIVHTIHGPSFGTFQGAIPNAVFLAAERRAGKVTTHFVTVADAMTEQYLAAGIGRREQFTRVYSGFDLKPYLNPDRQRQLQLRARWKISPDERWKISPDDVVVGKIARLFKLKGHDDLFAVAPELVRRCPQLKFLIVGDGEWRQRFETLAKTGGLKNHFVFTGLVAPDEIPGLVSTMDLVIHLSLREGLPRALVHALAAGRPVVAYDCDGAREVCRDNETGYLLQPGDLSGLADRIRYLAENAGLREELGRRGQQWVRSRFSVEKMVEDLHQLYLRLARDRGIPAP